MSNRFPWLLVLIAMAVLVGNARASNLLVSNPNDSGTGSLRATLASAANGDTIFFGNGVVGSIKLTSGALLISNSVTIVGPGASVLAINGNAASRAFYVSNTVATISGLTLSNCASRAIFNDGATLTIKKCNITGNSAAGSGGIYNLGRSSHKATLMLVASTVSSNSAPSGGGIENDAEFGDATVEVTASTISGNSAQDGGGIRNDGILSNATVQLMSSTLGFNSGFFGVGGGILNYQVAPGTAIMEIGDTILARGASGENITNYSGTVVSHGYNLCDDNGGGLLTAYGDQINAIELIGPLQDNGGPTPTHMPVATSPAIDKGKNLFGLATDQRGRCRTYDDSSIANVPGGGDGTDIGAVEVSPGHVTPLVTTNTDGSVPGTMRYSVCDSEDGETISFGPGINGTITLTQGEIEVASSVSIVGPGANVLAINGNAATRVFHVSGGVTAAISGLTITNANNLDDDFGGAIFNDQSTLTISNCTFTGNSATRGGGINNGGINNGSIYGGGATLTVVASTFSRNSAQEGGGILNDGYTAGHATMTVLTSTFNGNTASAGAGIFNDGGYSGSAILTMLNSTLCGNVASNAGLGGGLANYGVNGIATSKVVACTFSSNTAALNGSCIWNIGNGGFAKLEIGSSILNGSNSTSINISNSFATITSDGYNLSSDAEGTYLNQTTDRNSSNPLLGPLQDNGGPTLTVMPLAGSPAIDSGKNLSFLLTDQRGRCRTYDDPSVANAASGDGTDIGAVEINPAHTTVVATNGETGASLRWCICEAQPGDTITFASGVTGTVMLANGDLLVNKNLSIVGPGANLLAVNGNAASTVFYILNSTANISGLTITNGNGGGIINNLSTLTVSNCNITGNSSSGVAGGGIWNYGEGGFATLTLVNSTVSGNSATLGFGGGLYNDGYAGNATMKLLGCTVSGNTAASGGGGIYNTVVFGNGSASSGNATMMISNSTVSGNSCNGQGGGIYNWSMNGNATLTVGASTIASNSANAPFLAGGIFNSGVGSFLEIGDTILKTGAVGTNIMNSGTIVSDGYNLSSDKSGLLFLNALTDTNNIDPKLGPLANNGGPTFTHALKAGSPAIDKGKSFGLATDQRGQLRYDNPSVTNAAGGDGSDIGAYEAADLRIVNVIRTGNDLRLDFLNWLGTNYEVQSRSDMNAGTYTSLPGTTPGNGGIASTTVSNAFSVPQQFYRIHPVP